ncbi:GNAT family N-acetyltransferase [Uliginosibacterium paludis]|uniref:GNAT family N-acetyltransferase n=1 Tax=Uliginosibacterium paludis TaxID=1615952 RepID=A0ABV2CQD0_9RHOO
MVEEAIRIEAARESDADGIRLLMEANLAANGGSLSADLSRGQILALMRELPMVVARQGERIAGFLLTSSIESGRAIPILQAMLAAYAGGPDAYVYGPVCVAADLRGQGVAQAMFEALLRLLPGREGVLFVRADNEPSLRAHARMGMREVARFDYRDTAHVVFAYRG